MERYHIPVLQKEVLEYLEPRPNENFIDCTIGEAGHSLAILERTAPKGKVLGIDWSPEMIKKLKSNIKKLKDRLILVCENFVNLTKIVAEYRFKEAQGVLFDLGMSSWHLGKSGRGFSLHKEELLDMRYNPQREELTAQTIINRWPASEIEKILREYGEEKFAKSITKEIIKERKKQPIKTTYQLVDVIKKAVPVWYRQRRRIHFATRTFQALRIAVNDELNNLERVLPQSLRILKPGGKLVIISFHSLEDRIIKNFLRKQAKEGLLKILTKKPLTPTEKEIKINPRSRSAKLRAALKIPS